MLEPLPATAQATGATSTSLLASPKPPTPPPWPEAYVFLTNPDRNIFGKCCKRNYKYKWYSHCIMCHMDEKKV
jgi:hypothetical protein